MAWLVREGQVLASVEVAESFRGRIVGLLGRDGVEGALLLRPAWSVHTLGLRFPIDVAFLDRDLRVLRTTTMRPWRLGRPMLSSRAVLEAEAGAFASWELAVGDALELRDGS
jgi:uncharacterized membrane protein (UPF0127 family)